MSEAKILYFEPQCIADWKDGMHENSREGVQNFTPKFYAIRLIVSIHRASKEKPIDDTGKRIIREYVRDDINGLGDEVKEMFPELF
jgi:hypothetical protein